MTKRLLIGIILMFSGITFFAVAGVQDSPKATCKDGTFSFSKKRSGACSRHGGVKEWR